MGHGTARDKAQCRAFKKPFSARGFLSSSCLSDYVNITSLDAVNNDAILISFLKPGATGETSIIATNICYFQALEEGFTLLYA